MIYLSSIAAVRRLLDNYNCSSLIRLEKVCPIVCPTNNLIIVFLSQMAPDLPRPRPSIIPELPPNELPAPTVSPRHCQYLGKERYRYCGLFGDPHLKTFKNSYQTCRVRGAWPLIDNPYLAVQVTNEQVDEGSPATVTTKVSFSEELPEAVLPTCMWAVGLVCHYRLISMFAISRAPGPIHTCPLISLMRSSTLHQGCVYVVSNTGSIRI